MDFGGTRVDLEQKNITNEDLRKIGELLKTLEETDQEAIIIFVSDHGDMLGERGLWFKMSFFEGSARVPLMISASSMSSQVINSPVSTIDLCPTICELAGVAMSEVTPWITGESLCGIMQGEKRQNPVLMEYAAEASHAPMVCIRKDRWKYIFCSLDPEQLFDLDKDPHELDNLIEILSLNNIYFDLGKYTLRPESIIELDQVVAFLYKYNSIKITYQ